MATLTYWYAERQGDSDAYSIIAKTKKAAEAEREECGGDANYAPVEKRVIEYRDAFDLFAWVTGEAGGRGCGSRVTRGDT